MCSWKERCLRRSWWFLRPFGALWGAVVRLRNWCYDVGIFREIRVSACVVSVGNIAVGGSGKTPFVHFLAQQFPHVPLAILSRGYGAFPEEARWLQRQLPHVFVYVGKDRVALAKRAVARGAKLLLLDDGMQHRRLFRDEEVVLVQEKSERYIPAGILRDSPSQLSRATLLVGWEGEAVGRVDVVCRQVAAPLEKNGPPLQGASVALVSAIARPFRFRKSVEKEGGIVVGHWILPDHAKIPEKNLQKFAKKMQKKGAQYLVATEKDLEKISSTVSLAIPLFFLPIRVEIVEGREAFATFLAKIGQKIDNG